MGRLGIRHLFIAFGLCTIAGVVVAARTAQSSAGVTVHEWGTFTSVAGEDGQAIEWLPLSGPSDLPCFVRRMPNSPKVDLISSRFGSPAALSATPATVRMETPVLYFYSAENARLRVRVRFNQGLITEWFPAAAVNPFFAPPSLRDLTSSADWATVSVLPHAKASFRTEPGESHYYAARATDASPVEVAGEPEKFLFYRGIASFPVPLSVRMTGGQLEVRNTGAHDIRRLVVFENSGGRIGYRLAAGPRGVTTVDPPVLGAKLETLVEDLERMLVGDGLYPREAAAMVKTWRDAWFEPGTRVFYLVPRATVDAILPLQIQPAPADIARVFVGRVEVITPAMEADVEQALMRKDLLTLSKYGRVLGPITERVVARQPGRFEPARVKAMLDLVAAGNVSEHTCN